jgi:hypothetical protein
VPNGLASHFGLTLDAQDQEALQLIPSRNARQPQIFQADVTEKRAAITVEMRDIAARWLDQPYARLEELRTLSIKNRQSPLLLATS